MDSSSAKLFFQTAPPPREDERANHYQVDKELLRHHRLPALVGKLVELVEQKHPLREVIARANLPVGKGMAILRKLEAIGVLHHRPAGGDDRFVFNEMEESFFAKEVLPIDECDEPFESLGRRVLRVLLRNP
jgi:hypothetical protein